MIHVNVRGLVVCKIEDEIQVIIQLRKRVGEPEVYELEKCLAAAEGAGNVKDIKSMESFRESIKDGNMMMPRNYVRKYGFASRLINDNADYVEGYLFRPEYNWLDVVRLWTASKMYQEQLLLESSQNPLMEIVTKIDVPTYFLMGKYDGMTSPKVAQEYMNTLECPQGKEFILYEHSAHYPQFEESDGFYEWLCEKF